MQKTLNMTEFRLYNYSLIDKTPLHYACENKYLRAVKVLVMKGADVNAVTPIIPSLNKFSFL